MAANKIHVLRTKKGITQQQLAELADTSQQQIQRIEKGVQSVRFDLAVKICKALNEPVELVFPGTKRALEKLNKKQGSRSDLGIDQQFKEDMQRADVDMDPVVWFFKYRLRGGADGALPVTSMENGRIYRAVQRCEPTTKFIVFDSEDRRVVLNLDHLTFCHFLYNSPLLKFDQKQEEDAGEGSFKVFMADSSEPLRFGVDFDEWEEADLEEGEQGIGQFGQLTMDLENSTGEKDEVFSFTDEDGEEAVFRAADVAMIQFPLWVVRPEVLDEEPEEFAKNAPKGNA